MKTINDCKALEILEQGTITKTVKAGTILAHDITMPTGEYVKLVSDLTGVFLLIEA